MTVNRSDEHSGLSTGFGNGSEVLHYRIISKIGAGGMGEVYQALDTKLNRKVALKCLASDLSQDEDWRRRFTREAQAVAKLDHPRIITVYEVNEFEGRPFFSMSYIEGDTLSQYAAKRIPSIASIVQLGIQIADGLAAAHDLGMAHRDLKPGNIMIDAANKINILDFGLAAIPDSPSGREVDETLTKLTARGNVIGTVPYMAPEQLTGRQADASVDIFALGVILYELSCGERPFVGDSNSELASSILRDEPPTISEKRRDIPYDLARIIARCLRKNPAKRFQNVRDVGNELEELLELLEQGTAPTKIDQAVAIGKSKLAVHQFPLTAELVRSLSYKAPQMIGDGIGYLSNGVDSDVMIIFMHGLGLDQRQFTEALHMLPHRGIAPTLYGFDVNASYRPPLTVNDHSILLRALFRDLKERYRPRHVVLCGQSAGADHFLQLIESADGAGIEVSGLLAFGCNISLQTCVMTSRLARLTLGDESEVIEAIRDFGHRVGSLTDYLTVCEYSVMGFSKFGANVEAMQVFASGILQPFESQEGDAFPRRYRTVIERVPHVRFVFSKYEFEALDEVLRRHLENNVLGDRFREVTIVRENVSHLALSDPEIVMNHALAIVEQLQS